MATSPAMAYWVSGMRIPPFVSAPERVCQPRTGSTMPRCPTLWAASSDPDNSRRTSRTSTRTLDLALPAGQRPGCSICCREPAHIARCGRPSPGGSSVQNDAARDRKSWSLLFGHRDWTGGPECAVIEVADGGRDADRWLAWDPQIGQHVVAGSDNE